MSRAVIYMIALLLASGCAQKLYEYEYDGSLCPCIKINPEQMGKLESKAVNGDAESVFILAKYYMFTADDKDEELFWHKVAGLNGHASGMINAGHIYESRNEPEKALAWYMRAIKKEPGAGETYARIADLYENHLTVENHLALAREYYKRAALHAVIGRSIIKYAHEGIGGDKDNVEAYAWILVRNHTLFPGSWAANELEKLRKTVRSEMTDEEVSKAERLYEKYLAEAKKWRKNLLPNCEEDGVGCTLEDDS